MSQELQTYCEVVANKIGNSNDPMRTTIGISEVAEPSNPQREHHRKLINVHGKVTGLWVEINASFPIVHALLDLDLGVVRVIGSQNDPRVIGYKNGETVISECPMTSDGCDKVRQDYRYGEYYYHVSDGIAAL